MSFKRITRLVASAGVTAGLAFGGLATVGASSASAASTATAQATYTCSTPLAALPVVGPLLGSFDVPATITLQNLPDVLTDNVKIPAGTPILGTLDLTNLSNGGLAGLLATLGVTVNQLLGATPAAPVGIQVNNLLSTISGTVGTFQGTLSGDFLPTDALPLPIPSELGLDFGLLSPVLNLLQVKCALKPGSSIIIGNGQNGSSTTTVAVAKWGAKIKAKTSKKIKAGQKAVVKVKVKTTAGTKGVGTVMAKVKGQKAKAVSLKNGKVKLTFKKLRRGVNKIKLTYLGNGFTNAAKKKLKVTVVR